MGVVTETVEEVAETAGESGGGCLAGVAFILAIALFIFGGIKSCTNNMLGNHGGYITTLQDLNEYSTIESSPMSKEVGKISNDTVLKVQKVSYKGQLTWIMVYKLSKNDIPVKTYVLLPEKIRIKKSNKYVLYDENSRTWNNYYARIDQKNKPLYEKYKSEFKNAIKNIEVSKGNDNIVKESVKKTCWFLNPSGYFDLYISEGNEFYYINKNDKSKFLETYERFIKRYENEKIQYFQ